MIQDTFTRIELAALAEAFEHETWKWTVHAIEPDARVNVLFDPSPDTTQQWLVRVTGGWVWAMSLGDAKHLDKDTLDLSWNRCIRGLGDSSYARIPTEAELLRGGWHITTAPPVPEEQKQEPVIDEAKRLLDEGLNLLETPRPDMSTQCKTENHFLASIAISLYDLVALHKKYDFENVVNEEVPSTEPAEQTPGLDVSDDEINSLVDPEHRPETDPPFPWAQ